MYEYASASKIMDLPRLKAKILTWRLKDDVIVFTNGCFDLLHIGHVDYLEKAKQFGHRLIIGLNTDDSVRRLKGETRPYMDQHSRARVLAGLESVDAIIFFDEDTPEELIQALSPDVIVKGADYAEHEVAGGAFVKSRGGRVELVDMVEGFSTTNLVNKIKNS